MSELHLVRHGATEWSRNGRHTSVTDLDLLPDGIDQAKAAGERLRGNDYGLVLTSPRVRARRTAELAGFPDAEVDENLVEWAYGDYEGLTSKQIREQHPGWRIWTHPIPGGESRTQVINRLTKVVERVHESGVERALVFGHGHSLRVLALCWLGIDIARGQSFPLETGSVSVLGYEKESPAIIRWNS
ncbi:histidine phosphatase family protein [Aestuariimicrobium ganziense]|uniref:histidine phosphatase family protein n=1 Tax=Aestuariimicrobium ganziense TaxID=2773677 RepID=UPI001943D2F2|nr:histidine phosphatase family protein [Aestuariimicrobium ganziense]